MFSRLQEIEKALFSHPGASQPLQGCRDGATIAAAIGVLAKAGTWRRIVPKTQPLTQEQPVTTVQTSAFDLHCALRDSSVLGKGEVLHPRFCVPAPVWWLPVTLRSTIPCHPTALGTAFLQQRAGGKQPEWS